MMVGRTTAAVIVISCASLTQVAAQTLIDGSDPEQIVNAARGYGSAQLTTDSDGDPRIRGRIDGTIYVIFFLRVQRPEPRLR